MDEVLVDTDGEVSVAVYVDLGKFKGRGTLKNTAAAHGNGLGETRLGGEEDAETGTLIVGPGPSNPHGGCGTSEGEEMGKKHDE